MRILDDGPEGAEAHGFAVEMAIEDGDGALRDLWDGAPDKGAYGVPYVLVRCEGREIRASAVRESLRRFNEPSDDGWRWNAEALAAHLLHDLCGIALLGFSCPPSRGLCPHGHAYAREGDTLRWLGPVCAPCRAVGRQGALRGGDGRGDTVA